MFTVRKERWKIPTVIENRLTTSKIFISFNTFLFCLTCQPCAVFYYATFEKFHHKTRGSLYSIKTKIIQHYLTIDIRMAIWIFSKYRKRFFFKFFTWWGTQYERKSNPTLSYIQLSGRANGLIFLLQCILFKPFEMFP